MEKRTTLRILYALYVVLAALHILIHTGDLYFQDGRGCGVWQGCSPRIYIQCVITWSTLCLALGVIATLVVSRRDRFKYFYFIDAFIGASGVIILTAGIIIPLAEENFGAAFYGIWITGVLALSSNFIIKHLKPASAEQAAPAPEPEVSEADGEESVEVPPAAGGDLGAPSAGNVAMDVLPPRNA